MRRAVVSDRSSLLVAAGCAVRRPYTAPDVAPAQLSNVDPALVSEQPFDPRWWGQFEDPVLDELVSRALEANHDVRIAVARVDQARAFFDEVERDRFPEVTAGASVDRRRQAIPGFSDEPRVISTYQRRLRRVLGARCLRPRPVADPRGVGERRELRGRRWTMCG